MVLNIQETMKMDSNKGMGNSSGKMEPNIKETLKIII
jgi:hypothetical protein